MTESLGTAVLELDADQGPLNSVLSAMDGTVLGKVKGLASDIKGVFGGGLKAGMAVGAGAIVAGVAVAGKALYDLGAQFDDAYDKIRVGTGATGDELEGLKDVFRDVVSSVPTDFGTAADAITEVNRRLGLTGKPLGDVSKQFLELSRLTGTDLKGNIEAVSKAFVDWEVPVRKQSDTLDGFFRLSQESGIAVDDLAASVQQFGSPLRSLGFTLEESAAMFATFEKAGVNTSTMVPGLKLALANLSDPTDDLAKSLKQLGVDAKEPGDQLRQVFDLLSQDGLSSTEKMNLAMEVFGRRAGADMAEAIKQGRFEFDGMVKTFRDGNETITDAASDTNDLSENWLIFKNKVLVGLEPLATAVFDAINKGLVWLMDHGPEAIAAVSDGIDALKDVFNALKPVLTVIWEATKKAFAGIVNAVRGGLQVIGGIVKAFSALLRGDWDKLWDSVKQIVRGAWDTIKGVFQAITAPIRDLAKRIFDGVKDVADDAFDRIKAIISGAWDRIKDLVSGAVGRIKDVLSAAWDAIKDVANAAWDRVKDLVTAPIRAAVEVLRSVVDTIKSVLSAAWDRVKDVAGTAWGQIKDKILSPIQGALSWLGGLGQKLYDIAKAAFQKFTGGITAVAGDVKNAVSGLVRWITGEIGLINHAIDDAFAALQDLAEETANLGNGGGGGGGGNSGKVSAAALKAADDLKKALKALEQAEKDVADAKRDSERAELALTDARRSATRNLTDLQFGVRSAEFSQDDAEEALAAARAEVDRLRAEGATADEIAEAREEVAQAELAVDEATERAKRAREDLNLAEQRGVDGSSEVLAAQDAIKQSAETLTAALQEQAKAQHAVNEARKGGKGHGDGHKKLGAETLGSPVAPALSSSAASRNATQLPAIEAGMDTSAFENLAAEISALNTSGTRGVIAAVAKTVSEEQGYKQVGGRKRTAGDGRVTRHK